MRARRAAADVSVVRQGMAPREKLTQQPNGALTALTFPPRTVNMRVFLGNVLASLTYLSYGCVSRHNEVGFLCEGAIVRRLVADSLAISSVLFSGTSIEGAGLAGHGTESSSKGFSTLEEKKSVDSRCGIDNGLNRQLAGAFLVAPNISCPRFMVPQTYYD